MEKEFVPYELAVKLKELGFDLPCLALYKRDGSELATLDYIDYEGLKWSKNSELTGYWYNTAAPLWQQSFDWFRVKYNLDSYVRKTTYKQWKLQINYLLQDDSQEEWEKYKSYQDYKDTQGEARKACLEKLIQLVEDGNNNNK